MSDSLKIEVQRIKWGANRSTRTPFDTVEEMREILGVEDGLIESENFTTRNYTYARWGYTAHFEKNTLDAQTMERKVSSNVPSQNQ